MKACKAIVAMANLMVLAAMLTITATIGQAEEQVKIEKIQITVNPIFSEEERTGWLYETADKLHIDTYPMSSADCYLSRKVILLVFAA